MDKLEIRMNRSDSLRKQKTEIDRHIEKDTDQIPQETIDYIDWWNSMDAIKDLLEDAVTTNRPVALKPEEIKMLLDKFNWKG